MDKINTEAHSPCIKFKMTSAEQNTFSLLEPVLTWFCLPVNQSPDFFTSVSNLIPRGPFWHVLEKSGPLARSNDILESNGFVNTIDWDQNQSDLSDLTLSMRRVTGSPWMVDIRSWTWPEVAIPFANQKDRGLWERDWSVFRFSVFGCWEVCKIYVFSEKWITSSSIFSHRVSSRVYTKSW